MMQIPLRLLLTILLFTAPTLEAADADSHRQAAEILVEIYTERFTEEELKSIAASLRDPAMQEFLSNRFEMMQESMSRVAGLFVEFGIIEELESAQ